MKDWQQTALFCIAAGGSVFLLFAKSLGFEIDPQAAAPFGAIVTYVLADRWSSKNKRGGGAPRREEDDDDDNDRRIF